MCQHPITDIVLSFSAENRMNRIITAERYRPDMELGSFFKSIIDQDEQAIVICDLAHEIVYMNPAAVEEYDADTGAKLVGRSVMDCHPHWANKRIDEVVEWFKKSPENNIVHTFHSDRRNMDFYMVALRDGEGRLIGYYEKHESRTPERRPTYGME